MKNPPQKKQQPKNGKQPTISNLLLAEQLTAYLHPCEIQCCIAYTGENSFTIGIHKTMATASSIGSVQNVVSEPHVGQCMLVH